MLLFKFYSWTFLVGALQSVVLRSSFDDFLDKKYSENEKANSILPETVT